MGLLSFPLSRKDKGSLGSPFFQNISYTRLYPVET